jgi:hypothetical protein
MQPTRTRFARCARCGNWRRCVPVGARSYCPECDAGIRRVMEALLVETAGYDEFGDWCGHTHDRAEPCPENCRCVWCDPNWHQA